MLQNLLLKEVDIRHTASPALFHHPLHKGVRMVLHVFAPTYRQDVDHLLLVVDDVLHDDFLLGAELLAALLLLGLHLVDLRLLGRSHF